MVEQESVPFELKAKKLDYPKGVPPLPGFVVYTPRLKGNDTDGDYTNRPFG